MSETVFTTRKHFPAPTGKDFVKEGPKEIEELATAIDVFNEGQADWLKPGPVNTGQFSMVFSINSSTGEITTTGTISGVAWLEDPNLSGALTRAVQTAEKMPSIKPASLPVSGKYMPVGVNIKGTKWGAGIEYKLESGAEVASLGETTSPAIPAKCVKLYDVVIHNVSGVYSLVATIDHRQVATRALGFFFSNVEKHSATWYAKGGEFVYQEAGAEVILPVASTAPGQSVLVYATTNGTVIKTQSAAIFYGGPISGAPEHITLNNGMHVLLLCDGANWILVAGEPLNENKYVITTATKGQAETGFINNLRPTFVVAQSAEGSTGSITVEGVIVARELSTFEAVSFEVPAGQRWKSTAALERIATLTL